MAKEKLLLIVMQVIYPQFLQEESLLEFEIEYAYSFLTHRRVDECQNATDSIN